MKFQSVKALLFLLTIAVPLISCSEEESTYIPPSTSVTDKQFNFHVVAPGVWRSSQPNTESVKRMKMHGLKTIINLRGDEQTNIWEGKLSDSLGLNYFNFPLDARENIELEVVKDILEFVADTAMQPVLIHCLGGKDRTGLIAGIYKIRYQDAEFEDVKKEMIMFGHDAASYPHVLESVKMWQENLGKNNE